MALVIPVLLLGPAGLAAPVTVTVDGSRTFQTIEGFGANINHRSWNATELSPVLDAMVDQAGMTLFRVILDKPLYEMTNDNGNPSVMNWDYYNQLYSNPEFQKLWGLTAYLNQKGITNGVMFNFQGPGPAWMVDNDGYLLPGYEAEWAEMLASMYAYARNTQHLQFSLVAPCNEQEGYACIRITMEQCVGMLHALAQLLDANGMSDVRFVAPDELNTGTEWMAGMMSDPVVMAKLAHFGAHAYDQIGGTSDGIYDFLKQSPYPDRTFWMTEFNEWCTTCENPGVSGTNSWEYASGAALYMISHLANGASAALIWEGYDGQYNYYGPDEWSFWGLFALDDTNAVIKTYTPRKIFYTLSQISRFVRPGAVRINAGLWTDPISVIAFNHPDSGQITITGANTDASQQVLSATLSNLPPVAGFDLYYTDGATNLCHSATFPVTDGVLTATVPANCIFALVATNPAMLEVSVLVTNPPDRAYYTAPATIPIQASATTTTGSVSQVSFYCGTTNLGDALSEPYSITWSNVQPGTYVLSGRATNSLGHYGISPGVGVTVAGPIAQVAVTPANATLAPYSTQPFTATAMDALGTVLIPQPAFTWAAAGGLIQSNGLFTAGNPGGPFAITASAGGITGTAYVSISTNLNVALEGAGLTWHGLTNATDDAPRAIDPSINDEDLETDVALAPAAEDTANVYEAAGVIWPTTQRIDRVVYKNGSYTTAFDGVFGADFGLQFSPDGTTWTNAGPAWTFSPAYAYNSAAAAHVSFTFTGAVAVVRGVRCIGRVRTSDIGQNSWVANATEVQVFSAPISGEPAQIIVTPTNAAVVPYGSQQFTATALDVAGNATIPQPPFSWSISGGGRIDSNGLFTAGGEVGGPFTVTAGSDSLLGNANVSVATTVNLAQVGGGHTWHSLSSPNGDAPQAAAPGLNDGVLDVDVPLFPEGAWDTTNAYEAAGITWPTPQTIDRVVYYNGSYTEDGDGVFASNFRLQFSPDGSTWTNAGAAWTNTPAYIYNSPASADTNFTFTGATATVRGVRCVGRVHGHKLTSWVASATEVQAFAAPVEQPEPRITLQPTNQTAIIGADVGFGVRAGGLAPLSYQWLFNGTNLDGAVADTLTLTNVQPGQAGSYSVVVTNDLGSATSAVATLTVLSPPVITLDPTNRTVLVGGTVALSVAASGLAPLSYQWLFNGTNLAGATAQTLGLTNVQPGQAGSYMAQVTNLGGTASSAAAVLTVLHYPLLLNARMTTDAALAFTLSGDAGRNYVIEISTNLADWTPFGAVSNATGQADFADTTVSNSLSRFYRARLTY
jgi:O-glycosyl hydrolase